MSNKDEPTSEEMAAIREALRKASGRSRITYGGRDEEIAYLREAIAAEPDEDARVAMQARLDYVEAHTDAELREQIEGPPDTLH